MKVALVHDFFTQWGGAERILKIFTEIYPDAPIYLINYDSKLTAELLPGKTINASFLQSFPGMPKSLKWYLPLMPRAIESLDVKDFDVILSDSSAYAKGVIKGKNAVHVCYLHTPTRYLWSDRESYLASAPIPAVIRPFMPLVVNYLQRWDLKAAKRPDVIVANSHYIAERTKKYYHRNPDHVLFPPVEANRFHLSKKIGDYYLVVGRQEPYKRTDIAIEAANRLGLKLKVVGGGTKIEELKKLAGPTVEFTGRVSDDELNELYANCLAFLFPPKEDAGMTSLEAMASGRPVIAYAEGGALESVKPGVTGELFPEQTVESLIEVLQAFDPSNYNPEQIRSYALQYDEEVFKQKIRTIVEEAYQASLSS